MAPLAPVITSFFVSLGVGATAASLLTTASLVALQVGANYAIGAIFGGGQKKQLPGVKVQIQGGGVVPRSFLIGEDAATAGSLVYHGATAAGGKTPNAFYCATIACADLPCNGLTGIFVDGEEVTWNPDATPASGNFGIPIPEYNKSGKDHLWVQFFDGTHTNPDPFMRTWFGSDPDFPYTIDMIGRGVAYVRIIARVNQELFPNRPSFIFTWDGISLYDIRDDDTAGGDGDQRWNDPETWALRADPVSAIYNIRRGIFYDGEWFYGGQNLPASMLPYASWGAAPNECDADIDLLGGGTEKRYRISGEIEIGTPPVDVIEALLKACNGRMAEIGGIYKIVVGGPGAPVLSFTDDDILVTEDQEFDPFPDLDGTINGITARYPEPDEGFTLKDAPPLYDEELEAADGGRRLIAAVTYEFVTSGTQVQRLAREALLEERLFRSHNHVMPPSAYKVEPLDVVSFSSARHGYTNKLLRVDAAVDGDNCDQAWRIREVSPAGFEWETEFEQPFNNTPVTPQRPPVQPFVGWGVAGVEIPGDFGRARPGLRLSWDPDVDDVNGIQFQVRLASDETLVLSGETDAWDLGHIDISQNLTGGTTYEARGRYRPATPRETEWSSWLEALTPSVGEVSAADLDAAIQAVLSWAEQRVPQELDDLRRRLEDLAASANSHFAAYIESQARLALSVGEADAANAAAAQLSLTAAVNAQGAVAALIGTLIATTAAGTATTLLRFQSVSTDQLPLGVASSVAIELKAEADGEYAFTGLYLDAVAGGGSRIRMVADSILFQDPSGLISFDAFDLTRGGVAPEPAPIVDGAIQVDLSTGRDIFETFVNQSAAILQPIGARDGKTFVHRLRMDGSGGHTVQPNEGVMFGADPTINDGANVLNLIQLNVVRGKLAVLSEKAALEDDPGPLVKEADHSGATLNIEAPIILFGESGVGAELGQFAAVFSLRYGGTTVAGGGTPPNPNVNIDLPTEWERIIDRDIQRQVTSGGGTIVVTKTRLRATLDIKRLNGSETLPIFPWHKKVLLFSGGGPLDLKAVSQNSSNSSPGARSILTSGSGVPLAIFALAASRTASNLSWSSASPAPDDTFLHTVLEGPGGSVLFRGLLSYKLLNETPLDASYTGAGFNVLNIAGVAGVSASPF